MAYYPERAETPWVPEGAVVVFGPPVDSLRYDAHATSVFCDWITRAFGVVPWLYKGVRGMAYYGLSIPREKRH